MNDSGINGYGSKVLQIVIYLKIVHKIEKV